MANGPLTLTLTVETHRVTTKITFVLIAKTAGMCRCYVLSMFTNAMQRFVFLAIAIPKSITRTLDNYDAGKRLHLDAAYNNVISPVERVEYPIVHGQSIPSKNDSSSVFNNSYDNILHL